MYKNGYENGKKTCYIFQDKCASGLLGLLYIFFAPMGLIIVHFQTIGFWISGLLDQSLVFTHSRPVNQWAFGT